MSKQSAAAYSVARLLRESESEQGTGGSSLAQLTQQIDAFLADAPNAPPPVCVEETVAPTATEGRADGGETDAQYVEMNVVAGVLEEKPRVSCASMKGSDVLLPSEANQQRLHQQKADEAQALLNLMGALGCSEVGQQRPKVAVVKAKGKGAPAEEDSDSSSVAVMDADDLAAEDSSDDEPPPQRCKIEEI